MAKLKPRQIIGLVAIIVFGGGLIWRMSQPSEREVMEQRISSLMAAQREARNNSGTEFPDLPPVALPGSAAPAADGDTRPVWELAGMDYYSIGSQAAKDDLYCAGVLSAEFEATKASIHPDRMSMLIRDMQALETAGIDKLKAEGRVTDDTWAGHTLAWTDKAAKDYAANTLRMSVPDCTARAAGE